MLLFMLSILGSTLALQFLGGPGAGPPAHNSPEEDGARMRPVNLYVTSRAVTVLRVLVMLRTSGLESSDVVCHAMACQAELVYGAEPQQSGIGRSMRRVTCDATFLLYRSVFIGGRSLLVSVTFHASGVSSDRQPRLF